MCICMITSLSRNDVNRVNEKPSSSSSPRIGHPTQKPRALPAEEIAAEKSTRVKIALQLRTRRMKCTQISRGQRRLWMIMIIMFRRVDFICYFYFGWVCVCVPRFCQYNNIWRSWRHNERAAIAIWRGPKEFGEMLLSGDAIILVNDRCQSAQQKGAKRRI